MKQTYEKGRGLLSFLVVFFLIAFWGPGGVNLEGFNNKK